MKTLLTTFFILVVMAFFSSETIGANYHFSREIGNDSRSFTESQNPSTQRKSIQKLNSIFLSVKAGDKTLFAYDDRKGETSVALNGEYVDMNNKFHTGSIKLAPFSSIISIKTSESEIQYLAPIQEVRVINPENGSAIMEGEDVVINVKVDEGKEGEIEKIHYYFSENLIASQTENPFLCEFKDIPSGKHYVHVAAVDKQGRTVHSDTVMVQVNKENISPVVNIESPSKDNDIFKGETIKIVGNAIDLDGEILEVGFYANEKLIGRVKESPFQFNWNNAPAGNHALTISAKDNNQAVSISEAVNIKVVKNTDENLIPITSTAPEVLTTEYLLNVNLGNNQKVNWETIDFEGEAAITSQIIGRSNIYSNSSASDEALFQSERNGEAFQIEIPVQNGTYTIKTYHNELWFGHKGPMAQKGRRVFDISLENNLVKKAFDLFEESNNQPVILTFEKIIVEDGVLNIKMSASKNRATISAISILPESLVKSSPPNTDFNLFLNTGGQQDENFKEVNFSSETNTKNYFNTPSYRYENNGASNEKLFQTERNSENLKYSIPVPNGTYTVHTMHNELWFGHHGPSARAGRRVFDIFVQDKKVKSNFDLFSENDNQPTILTFEHIEVTGSMLNIELFASKNRASISGIVIVSNSAGNSSIQKQNLRGYREMLGRGYKEMIGRGYKEMDIYFDDVMTENMSDKFNLFPNPAKDIVTVTLNGDIPVSNITIHDMGGQLVQQIDPFLVRDINQFIIPLTKMRQGVYLISIWNTQESIGKQRLIVHP